MKKCVLITQEHISLSEVDAILSIIDNGCWRVHIRKPNAHEAPLRLFLDALCRRVDPKYLSMHYYHNIALEYGFGGLHGKCNVEGVMKSLSCHSIEEIESAKGLDYLFISPVFDSISKKGYKAAVDIKQLSPLLHKKGMPQITALGGVEKSNLHLLDEYGFENIALLGAVWRDGEAKAVANFKDIVEKWR